MEQPVGVFRIGAAADQHRQAVVAGQPGGRLLAGDIAAQHQDQLRPGWDRQPPAPRQPQQAGDTDASHQPASDPTAAAALASDRSAAAGHRPRPVRRNRGLPPGRQRRTLSAATRGWQGQARHQACPTGLVG